MRERSSGHATLADVARRCGVSVATVSLALNGNPRVALGTRERVLEIARGLNYSPNVMAQGLVNRRSRVIGLILPGVRNAYFARVAESIERSTLAMGYRLITATTGEDPVREAEAIRSMIGLRVDGLILTSCAPSSAGRTDFGFPEMFPVVLLGRRVEHAGADRVVVDHFHGAQEAIGHLLDGGCKRIGLITGPQHLSDARSRLEGYRAALAARGVPERAELIIEGRFDEASGRSAMAALLEQRVAPDAVFVSNIEMLRGALRVLQERGVRVPADLALVSNDRSDWLDLLTVPVSSVEQPTDSMGALAVELLLRRIEQPGRPPEWRELKPEFVIRDSSRKAGGSRRRRSQDP